MKRIVTVRLSIEDDCNNEEIETVRQIEIEGDIDDLYNNILDVIYEGGKER